MKKYLLVLLGVLLLIPANGNAVIYDILDERCTSDVKLKLKREANEVTYRVSKTPIEEIKTETTTESNETTTTEEDDVKVRYNVTFYNIADDLVVTLNDKDVGTKIDNLKPGRTISVIIKANEKSYCATYKARTIKISIPYYNKYSESEICNNYRDYILCKENANVTLTEEEFNKQMNRYIESLKKEEKKEEEVVEKKSFDFMKFLSDYGLYIGAGVGVIAVTTAVIVIYRKRKYGIL